MTKPPNTNAIIKARFKTFKQMVDSTVYNANKEDAKETLISIMNDCEVELSLAEAKKQLLLKQLNYIKHLLTKIE
ncbi:hypothetical protein [Arthrospira platensis]|uniref:hypothetical protein n=1 Tax=Limnospira platensis TaxID=118562 RepID=UPI0007A0E381|nr:hypothetical protein AP285_25080 [Arthrospira platensis YZ]